MAAFSCLPRPAGGAPQLATAAETAAAAAAQGSHAAAGAKRGARPLAAASEARRQSESPMAFWDVVVVRRQRDTETLQPTEVKEFIKGLGSVEDFLKADGCQAHSGPYFL